MHDQHARPIPRSPRIPGDPGVWVFLFGDMALFVVFFVAYLLDRGKAPALFAESSGSLALATGVVNVLVLLASSLAVVAGLEAYRRRASRPAAVAFAASLAFGVVFVAIKVSEYAHLGQAGHGPSDNAFFTWYYVLTGVHLLHVLLGLVVLWLMLTTARADSDEPATALVESGACYWHLVDLLWMVIFPLVYLVA